MPRPIALLRLDQISHRYGNRILFRDLSSSFAGGTRTAIVGPNGSGKSTLLKIVGSLLQPSHGSVHFELAGRSVDISRRPLHVGIVAPYANLYDGLTAAENLQFIRRLRGLAIDERYVHDLLVQVGLEGRADDLVSTYSSGMVQRLRLAAALLPEPEILLLDEASITLDSAGSNLLSDAVDRTVEAGGIVVSATNLKHEAEQYERVIDVRDFA